MFDPSLVYNHLYYDGLLFQVETALFLYELEKRIHYHSFAQAVRDTVAGEPPLRESSDSTTTDVPPT
jgi:hypothetical protein